MISRKWLAASEALSARAWGKYTKANLTRR